MAYTILLPLAPINYKTALLPCARYDLALAIVEANFARHRLNLIDKI